MHAELLSVLLLQQVLYELQSFWRWCLSCKKRVLGLRGMIFHNNDNTIGWIYPCSLKMSVKTPGDFVSFYVLHLAKNKTMLNLSPSSDVANFVRHQSQNQYETLCAVPLKTPHRTDLPGLGVVVLCFWPRRPAQSSVARYPRRPS